MKSVSNVFNLKTCPANCSICKHPLKEEIHKMRGAGEEFKTIIKFVEEKGKKPITGASLSRHFSKYREIVKAEVQRQEITELQKEATEILSYQKWTNKMMERAFQKIWKRFDSMVLDISDLERLAKLRILLKEGDSEAGEGITDIFEKAAKKYNIQLDQPDLFVTEPSNPINKAIDVTPPVL